MSQLFTPLHIRDVTFRNRLWVSPMCMYSAVDGVVNDWHHVHLSQFATGGAGLVIAEAAAVVPEGRISPEDAGIWSDTQGDAWRPIVRSIRMRDAVAGIQLAHAGRKASVYSPFAKGVESASAVEARRNGSGAVPSSDGGWTPEAPSVVAHEGFVEPIAMDTERIGVIIEAFRRGARRAIDAGFQVLEIHAAHGYLLHEFLSPLTNFRTDEYGGTLENRARLTLEIVRGIRAEIGQSIPLFVRVSATDSAPGGLDVDDVARVASWMTDAGADLIDVSSSGLVAHQRITAGPGYQVPFAARIRKLTGALTGAVGIITGGRQAEQILKDGTADVILAGREWLRDPHFALRAATELGEAPEKLWPKQYLRAHRA